MTRERIGGKFRTSPSLELLEPRSVDAHRCASKPGRSFPSSATGEFFTASIGSQKIQRKVKIDVTSVESLKRHFCLFILRPTSPGYSCSRVRGCACSRISCIFWFKILWKRFIIQQIFFLRLRYSLNVRFYSSTETFAWYLHPFILVLPRLILWVKRPEQLALLVMVTRSARCGAEQLVTAADWEWDWEWEWAALSPDAPCANMTSPSQ